MGAGARAHQPSRSSSSSTISSPRSSRSLRGPGPVAAAAGTSAATREVGAAAVAPPGARTPLAAAAAGAKARCSQCRTSLPATAAGRAHAKPSLRLCPERAEECLPHSAGTLRWYMPLVAPSPPGRALRTLDCGQFLFVSGTTQALMFPGWPCSTIGTHTPTFTWLAGSAPPPC